MKITINIDCTPEEARRYMGLPDVAPMQEAIVQTMQERMMANISAMQPTEMMQTWLPTSLNGWLDLQKQFWTKMMSVGTQREDHSSQS